MTLSSGRSIEHVATQALLAYAREELDAFSELLSSSVVYALYLDEDIIPFAGEVTGRTEFLVRLSAMRDAFDYLVWRPTLLRCSADGTAHAHVDFMYMHKRTYSVLEGSYRLVFKVSDDHKIARIEEHHDAARVHAFMRLLAQ